MRSLTIGIDPGLSGAIAFIYDNAEQHVYDLPIVEDKSLKWIDGAALTSLILQHPGNKWAFVERVCAMPSGGARKQGAASSFQFGVGFGAVLATIQALQIPLQLVAPSKWKRDLGLSADKAQSLGMARMRFPSMSLARKKDSGRAEALLIAHWGGCHCRRVLPVERAA